MYYIKLAGSGSGLQYAVIAQIAMGSKVTILEKDEDWYLVRLSDGKTGWAIEDYLSSDPDSSVDFSQPNAGVGASTKPYFHLKFNGTEVNFPICSNSSLLISYMRITFSVVFSFRSWPWIPS
ncbi:SH3 domain-containing protein [Paenibacillus sp. SI8]|uniref:SH3 domain-containing protein n=1 Tax=unclassified Paenibacillus TaxID=185978 RepID=UPI003467974B